MVTKDGVPLAGAQVEFYPTGNAAPSYGKTDDNGAFKLYYSTGLVGALVGEHRVHIIGGRKIGEATPSPVPAPAPPPPMEEMTEDGEPAPVPLAAPEGAATAANGGAGGPQPKVLTATVAPGKNHLELKL